MLDEGRRRLLDKGYAGNIDFVEANAEDLPFEDNQFDCITIAFGLRNVTHQDRALRSMYRVLKPGGRLLVLEFSRPLNRPLGKLYELYSFSVLPRMGELVAKDGDSYRYLAESIRMHPDQETLKAMMEDAGFERCEQSLLADRGTGPSHGMLDKADQPREVPPSSWNQSAFADRQLDNQLPDHLVALEIGVLCVIIYAILRFVRGTRAAGRPTCARRPAARSRPRARARAGWR